MSKQKGVHANTANNDAALCLETAKIMLFLQTAPEIPIFFTRNPTGSPPTYGLRTINAKFMHL
jgi:hypothetical protein